MPNILRRLPFYAEATTLRIPNGPAIQIQHDQIAVWVSIGRVAQTGSPTASQRFPALIDLGFNGSFLLREDHVNQWAKIQLGEENFPFLDSYRAYGDDIAIFAGDVWLYPNIPGFRDQFAITLPLRLDLIKGIAVAPASMTQFRLPLLGVSALRKNRLRLLVNGEKRYISLRTPFRQD
jgi:hypothetical protein